MNKKRSGNRFIAAMLIFVMLISLLAACGSTETNDGDQERVLRIATSMGYGPDNDWLRQQFTDLFEFTHKNITIEFIPTYDEGYRYYGGYGMAPNQEENQKTPLDRLKEAMDGTTPPDVILMEFDHLAELIRENRLEGLETLMQKSQLSTEEFVPAVIDGLKGQSEDGKLYALAPMFTSSALIYNKKLFIDAGVPFPTDDMTWDQTFQLARQISRGEGNDRVYGLSFNSYRYSDPFYDMNVYTAPLELQIYDDNGEKMTVNTPEWKKAWQTFIDLKNEQIFPGQPDYSQGYIEPVQQGPYDYHSLLSGKVAMSMINYYELSEILNVNKNAANIDNFEAIDWDVVTVPTHPEAPGIGGQVWLNGIMGISASAQNREDAWRFIQFMMSEEWAVQKSKSVSQFVTWGKYNKQRDGLDYNLNAFFKNTPVKNNLYNSRLGMEKPDIWHVHSLGQMKFQEVMNNNKTVDEALREWETEGDAILQKLKENNGWLGEGGYPGRPMPMPIDSVETKVEEVQIAN